MPALGKIARLPSAVREELNRRLRSGTLGTQLLPWLNGLPEVRAVLEEHFGNKDINDQNLSAWRQGEYQKWLEKQDDHFQRIERTRELAALSMKLAEAGGGNLTDGASAIVAGEILGVLEELERFKAGVAADLTKDDIAPDRFQVAAAAIESLSLSISRLRKGDQNKEVLRQRDEQLRQKDEELQLAREKFQQDTAEAVLKSAKNAAIQNIANAPMDYSEQLNAIGEQLFPGLWKPTTPAPK